MNTITQIYEEHASMPPHGERRKNESENLINYLLHDGEYVFMLYRRATLFLSSLINSSSLIVVFVYDFLFLPSLHACMPACLFACFLCFSRFCQIRKKKKTSYYHHQRLFSFFLVQTFVY